MLRSKRFKALSTLLPNCARIGLHGADYALLFYAIKVAKALRETVDVEHDKIGQQCNYDDDVDKHSGREIIIDAPKGLLCVSSCWPLKLH